MAKVLMTKIKVTECDVCGAIVSFNNEELRMNSCINTGMRYLTCPNCRKDIIVETLLANKWKYAYMKTDAGMGLYFEKEEK